MTDVAGALINGLILGSQYALFAAGLALIIGVMRILNLAHAVLFVAGGYVTYWVAKSWALPLPDWITIALCGVVGGLVSGAVLELVGLAPLRRRAEADDITVALLTVGFAEAAISGLGLIAGTEPKPIDYQADVLGRVGTATVTVTGIASIVVAALLFFGLYWVVQRTRLGLQMQSVAASAADSELVGLDSRRIIRMTVLAAAVLAGVGGAYFVANVGTIDPLIGNDLLVKGAAIVIVGGMGSIVGAVVVAYAIGLAETFAIVFIGSDVREVVALTLLVAILLFRPQGLFGRVETQRL
jgi:branched-chain amino acid transport system permease protein